MNYPTMFGLGVVGLVLTKVAVDTLGGYVFTSKLLRDGLSRRETEQRVSECMPSDMKYASKAGREIAYWSHNRAVRRENDVEQL